MKNPVEFKKSPPDTFENKKLTMVFHKESKRAKLFLKDFVDGWSLIVWQSNISDTIKEICSTNSKAVLWSNDDTLKLLCMYKIKFTNEINLVEV